MRRTASVASIVVGIIMVVAGVITWIGGDVHVVRPANHGF